MTKLTDALGNETRYTYDTAKMLMRKEIWQKDGATLTLLRAKNWTYDTNGNKVSEWVTLDSGETITRSWTYEQNWIASEQVVSSAALSKIFRTEYTFYFGTDGRPINIQSEKRRRDDGSFQTTTYTYDTRNRVLTTTLPDGVQMVNEYTGDFVARTYFAVSGLPLPQMERRFEYDAEGNKIKEWDARNNLTQFSYDDRHRPISVTNPLGEQTLHAYLHDMLTQTEVGRTAADGEGQVTKFLYDARDRLIGIQRKNDAGTFVNYRTFQLDSEGQRIAVTDAENRTMALSYDLLGRMKTQTDPSSNTTQLSYDAAGNRTSIIDALTRVTQNEFDDLNRLTAMVQLGVTPNARTEYAYDAADNIVSVKDAENHSTTYAYDALSRNTRVTQALGQFVQLDYDERDHLDFVINARGNKTDYEYSSWGGLVEEKQYPTASSTTPDRTIAYAHDYDGNITSIADDVIQAMPAYSLTYDAMSRLYDETVKYLPGGDRLLQHRYDRFGNRKQLTLQEGTAVTHTYTYNKLNQLASANLAGAAIAISHFANDDRQSVALPNGVTEAFTYRPNGPAQSVTFTGPSGQVAQFAYTYDDVRNVDTQSDQYGLHDFDYDGLNRLTQALRPAGASLPNESYAYDRVGNREDPANAALYGYDANNRITGSSGLTYTFDSDGNLASPSDGAVFVHDARNRPVGYTKVASTSAYLYDAYGRRVRKSVDGVETWFLWDGINVLAEYDAAGIRTKRYAYVQGDYVPKQMQDGNGTYYVHADSLQSPRLMTNSIAQVVWRARYEVFGRASVESDPDGNGTTIVFNQRLPGQYFDAETALHYNYFRSYDPALGRYVEADPIGQLGDLNVYEYAEENPLVRIDPLGLKTCGSGWSDYVVPDNPGFPFSDCCVEHDECYDGKCGEYPSREQCDREFQQCMYRKCKAVGFRKAADCVWAADTYYFFVRAFGGGPFRDARATPSPGAVYGYVTAWQRLAAPPRR